MTPKRLGSINFGTGLQPLHDQMRIKVSTFGLAHAENLEFSQLVQLVVISL